MSYYCIRVLFGQAIMHGWATAGQAARVWTIDDRTTSSLRGRISAPRIEGPSTRPSVCLATLPSPLQFELDALAELYYSLISCVRACVRAYVSDCIWQPQLLWLC